MVCEKAWKYFLMLHFQVRNLGLFSALIFFHKTYFIRNEEKILVFFIIYRYVRNKHFKILFVIFLQVFWALTRIITSRLWQETPSPWPPGSCCCCCCCLPHCCCCWGCCSAPVSLRRWHWPSAGGSGP